MSFTIQLSCTLRQGDFTLDVRQRITADAVAVVGPSGAGKTTLLESIAGLRSPDAGEIEIGGRTVFSASRGVDVPARDRRVGYVPQDALLFPHMSVRGNIAFGSHSQDGLEPLLQILDVGGLLDRRVSKLSGGEKQRVAIARALMTRPSILLLDEPLAGVDRERREVILPYILRIRRELHVPLMYVTHDEAELRAIADRVLRLEKN